MMEPIIRLLRSFYERGKLKEAEYEDIWQEYRRTLDRMDVVEKLKEKELISLYEMSQLVEHCQHPNVNVSKLTIIVDEMMKTQLETDLELSDEYAEPILRFCIDMAIDNGNEEEFLRLSSQLNDLMKRSPPSMCQRA